VKRNAKCNIVRENAFTVSQLKLEQTRNFSDKNISPQWSPRMMNNLDISEEKTVRISTCATVEETIHALLLN
jgi:hypothetical protein